MRATPADIIKAVCMRFDLNQSQIIGRNARRPYARPRQIAMFLAREMTTLSYPQIGAKFNRDHTTIMWATRTIANVIVADRGVLEAVESCREIAKILAGGRAVRRREAVSKPLVEVREAA